METEHPKYLLFLWPWLENWGNGSCGNDMAPRFRALFTSTPTVMYNPSLEGFLPLWSIWIAYENLKMVGQGPIARESPSGVSLCRFSRVFLSRYAPEETLLPGVACFRRRCSLFTSWWTWSNLVGEQVTRNFWRLLYWQMICSDEVHQGYNQALPTFW